MQEISLHCPFCDSPRKSFRYNTSRHVWMCWRCGKAGCGNREGQIPRLHFPRSEREPDTAPDSFDFTILAYVPKYKPSRRDAEDYLRSHHIRPENVWHDVAVDGINVVVPVQKPYDVEFCQYRSLREKSFFFVGAVEGKRLFVRGAIHSGAVYLVESAFSALRLDPFVCSAATFGTKLNRRQIREIRNLSRTRPVRIAFDSDAFSKAQQVRSDLRVEGVNAQVCPLPWGDPCDWPDREIKQWLAAQ